MKNKNNINRNNMVKLINKWMWGIKKIILQN